MSGGAIKHSFSVRGLSADVTQEALSSFFTSIGASVASIRMVSATFFFCDFFFVFPDCTRNFFFCQAPCTSMHADSTSNTFFLSRPLSLFFFFAKVMRYRCLEAGTSISLTETSHR
jgi:hypothetical protein